MPWDKSLLSPTKSRIRILDDMADKDDHKDLVSNRKAFHDYEILETFEAGIVLMGTEVKSLRNHEASLQEAYVAVTDGELWLLNCSINPYRFGNIYNHEERRPRKLLMHHKEIVRLASMIQEKGITVIPLAFYLAHGKIKIKIAAARGKKHYDKRASIKERDDKRNIQRAMKDHV